MRLLSTVPLFILSLILIGAGCSQPVPDSSSAKVSESATTETDVNDIETEVYLLDVDDAYTVSEESYGFRIQNYEGSDDPRMVYADEAFMIEIWNVGEGYGLDDMKEDYGQVTERELDGRTVYFGADGRVGGEQWMHEAYFDDQSDTLMVIYANALPGNELGQAVVAALQWK